MSQKSALPRGNKLVIVFVVALILFALYGLLVPSLAWSGAKNVTFRFRVTASGGYPLEGAKVRIIRSSQLESLSSADSINYLPYATIDTNGFAEVSVMCGAGGGSGLFGKTGRWIVSHELLVEAPGYRSISVPLETVLGRKKFPISKHSVDVKLIMFKQPELKN